MWEFGLEKQWDVGYWAPKIVGYGILQITVGYGKGEQIFKKKCHFNLINWNLHMFKASVKWMFGHKKTKYNAGTLSLYAYEQAAPISELVDCSAYLYLFVTHAHQTQHFCCLICDRWSHWNTKIKPSAL